jgi:hypothetical protein
LNWKNFNYKNNNKKFYAKPQNTYHTLCGSHPWLVRAWQCWTCVLSDGHAAIDRAWAR